MDDAVIMCRDASDCMLQSEMFLVSRQLPLCVCTSFNSCRCSSALFLCNEVMLYHAMSCCAMTCHAMLYRRTARKLLIEGYPIVMTDSDAGAESIPLQHILCDVTACGCYVLC